MTLAKNDEVRSFSNLRGQADCISTIYDIMVFSALRIQSAQAWSHGHLAPFSSKQNVNLGFEWTHMYAGSRLNKAPTWTPTWSSLSPSKSGPMNRNLEFSTKIISALLLIRQVIVDFIQAYD